MRITWPWRRRAPQLPPPVDQPAADDRLTQAEIRANLLTIYAVPRSVLPEGPAREALMQMAAQGADVYAYASGGEERGVWCVWYGPLAKVRTDHDGRVPAGVWARDWVSLSLEAAGGPRRRPSGGPEGGAA